MMQLYFLSILLNVFVALFLFDSKFREQNDELLENNKKQKLLSGVSQKIVKGEFLENSTVALIVGILSFIVGFIKLFVVAGDRPVILGDLFPSIAGIAGGFSLLLNYFLKKVNGSVNVPQILKSIFIDKAYIIGFCCIVISIFHFIIPQVLFF